MKIFTNTNSGFPDDYVSYEISFSTAEMESMLFYGDFSPGPYSPEIAEPENDYRLIGDELMHVDRKNLPPNGVTIEE